jgi:hypothetical protein
MSTIYPIYFVTTLDLITISREKVRCGAVGIWDTATKRIAFRKCDMIDWEYDNLAVYEEDVIMQHRNLLQIECAM